MKKILLLFIPLMFFFSCEEEENNNGYNCSTISGNCVESIDGFFLNLQDCENECQCENDADDDGICDELDNCPEWYNPNEEECCADCQLMMEALLGYSSELNAKYDAGGNTYLFSNYINNLSEGQPIAQVCGEELIELEDFISIEDWNDDGIDDVTTYYLCE